MQQLSSTVRLILVFLAAAVAAFAAAPPVDLPGWAAGLIAALAAGFAGIGLLPPGWQVNSSGDHAIKHRPKSSTSSYRARGRRRVLPQRDTLPQRDVPNPRSTSYAAPPAGKRATRTRR